MTNQSAFYSVQEKRKIISASNKIILENWYQLNKEHPYAKKKDLFELQRGTNLAIKTIQRWLDNRRANRRKKDNKQLSPEEKCYLLDFFEKTNGYPEYDDFKVMCQDLQRTEKQLRVWFSVKRFRDKQNKYHNR